jgi:hypothetical protein
VSITGTYAMQAKTPFGLMKGTMQLSEKGEKVCGKFTSDMGDMTLEGAVSSPGTVQFEAKVKTLLGRISAAATVSIAGDEVSGTISSSRFGTFPVQGKRVPPPG